MKGNNEVNYSIYIITEYGKHWFNKTSIWNDNNEYESLHEITKSDYVYNTFCELYPILKEYDRENIEIHKCWESWHPVCDDKPRVNKYDEKDDYKTRWFNIWIEDNKKES